jgi:hypothetical protein
MSGGAGVHASAMDAALASRFPAMMAAVDSADIVMILRSITLIDEG